MEKFTKLLSVFLVATMIFTTFSMGISVSAENVTTETNATSNSPLEIEVTTNKSNYGLFDVADITVNITNISDNTVENISAEVVFDDLAPVKKKTSETYKEVERLQSGESFSFSYRATISKNKLNLFGKVALWFVRLFNGGYTATANTFNNGRKNIEYTNTLKFDNKEADNVIIAWYGFQNQNSGLSSEDVSKMNLVDKSISDLMNSDDYKNLDSDESKAQILMEKLSQLEKEGIIEKNSICYYKESNQITFNYSNGVPSGILIDSVDNSISNDKLFDVIGPTSSLNLKSISVEAVTNSINRLNGIAMYGYDDSSSEDSYYNEWNNLIKEISDFGMTTAIYDKASVSDYKTAFIGYDYICIFEHGIYLEGYDTCSFVVAGENASEELDIKYGEDIKGNLIYRLLDNGVAKYYITPKFFSYYYNDNRLKDSFVFLLSCESFGAYGEINYGFAEAFYNDCGCDTIIGFHNSVFQIYGTAIFKDFTMNMLCGNSAQESLDICTDKHGMLDINYLEQYLLNMHPVPKEYLEKYNEILVKGNHAFPCLYGDENKILNNYSTTISGTVKDKTTGSAISGVKVEFVDNSSDSLDPVATAMTDENGLFSVKLPYGSYSISFNHDNYEYYGTTVNADTENIILTEAVLLTPILITPKGNCITQMEIVDHGQYTGNEGDSCVFHLDKSGLPGIHNAYCAFGNVGVDGTEYENGLEVWIARWNYRSEISWAYATYKLNSNYTTLTGKTNLIQSNNIDNFNTTVYFYDGDTLLASYTLTNDDYIKDINVDVTGVDELKILVQDNVAVCKGTSFALYDMFLA